MKLSSRNRDEIVFGTTEIDLRRIDQLFDPSQTRAIASAIHIAATRFMRSDRALSQVLDDVEALLDAKGLDILDPFRLNRDSQEQPEQRLEGHVEGRHFGRHPGAFARPRRFEIAAAINRMRSLRVAPLELD